jgi:hypothetical protein
LKVSEVTSDPLSVAGATKDPVSVFRLQQIIYQFLKPCPCYPLLKPDSF